jgi:hypothetical protein
MTEHTTIGVLALQGAFAEHLKMLKAAADQLGASVSLVEVRTPAELSNLDGMYRYQLIFIANHTCKILEKQLHASAPRIDV